MEEEMVGACRVYEGAEICRILVRKPEGKRPLVRPRYMWDDAVKRDMEIEM
jgi:hypothetical protein